MYSLKETLLDEFSGAASSLELDHRAPWMADPTTLRVLTLNCWGLKYVSKKRHERIRAISDVLANSNYDIISLQELWADYGTVKAKLLSRFRWSKFFYSGAFGSGLAIFSRYPIVASSVWPFSCNGSPIDVTGGDWFVGKACTSVLIEHPVLGEVEVYNTHLYAKGSDDGPELNRATRISNAWEMAKLVRSSLAHGRHVICTGDYNSLPTSLAMQLIIGHANLTDAWEATHPQPPSSPPRRNEIGAAARAIDLWGVTADSPLNSWSRGKPLGGVARKWLGKRLDYILFRSPKPHGGPHLDVQETKVVFTEMVPGCDYSYSDHFGLEGVFTIKREEQSGSSPSVVYNPPAINRAISGLPPGRVAPVIEERMVRRATAISGEALLTAIGALTHEYRLSQARTQTQLAYFYMAVVILVLVLAGSPYITSKSWVPPISATLAALATWSGTTFLYIGFIFGNWERNMLTNIIEEMETLKDIVERRSLARNSSGVHDVL